MLQTTACELTSHCFWKGFYLLGPFLCSLWEVFVDYGSAHQIWQHIAKGSTQARALQTTEKTHDSIHNYGSVHLLMEKMSSLKSVI